MTDLPLTLDGFRTKFSRTFRDRRRFTDASCLTWLRLGARLLPADRWGEMLELGIYLFAAHNISLEAQAEAEGAAGLAPGGKVGPVSSKSAGGISLSYDVSSGIEAGDGHWTMTSFGRRFIHTCKIVGMGGVQVGGSAPIPGGWWPGSGSAYDYDQGL
jgi:hypothetical protein